LLLSTAPLMGEPMNPNTDWFHDAGYGVFVHYLTNLQNEPSHIASLGKETSWDECVAEFDTERFAETMAEVRARYVIFTVMQVQRYMAAPNATYDEITGYEPGEACATRDLIMDLSDSLRARDIRLMLYYTGDGPRADPQAAQAFGCGSPVSDEFVEKWTSVAREYSLRYGDRISGWWVDGCYPWIGYNDDNLAVFAEALKAGNPEAIVAFNRGVDPEVMPYTPHEDYTCGEQNRFYDMPESRWIEGEQWHILSYLGPWWGDPGTKYAKQELADYVWDVHRRGGVVSIDVLLFRDGGLDRSQVEMLKAVGTTMDEGQNVTPIPPGNLAFRMPSLLLSLDGGHELVPSGETNVARHGVDGDPSTYAQGANEWPWTYHVDLIDTVDVRRVKVTFGPSYATGFEVRLSADGEEWTTIAERTGHDGTPVEVILDEPIPARYVRVLGLKPDGPDQPGGQMSIAELEVYD
ncbi:MAG: hypothetical protein GF320_21990, partial [Armatimonadia bacterium]|nr:hypothetical protein [Armatimonadia bacterium]